jgi:uncharacterized protein YecE (DUF72 family)
MTSVPGIFIGCAGWSLRTDRQALFPQQRSHLQRYAARFNAVEINSSFYRAHRPATYERWANEVPQGFRFAVKVPKEITHTRRLIDVGELTLQFLSEVNHLGEKLGPLLVQLPPTLQFRSETAAAFFLQFRAAHEGSVVCEPRHASWFTAEAEELLTHYHVARAAADPAITPAASEPGGYHSPVYFRWHGSPVRYYSSYTDEALIALAEKLRQSSASTTVWVIFDNTAEGAALDNALKMMEMFHSPPREKECSHTLARILPPHERPSVARSSSALFHLLKETYRESRCK